MYLLDQEGQRTFMNIQIEMHPIIAKRLFSIGSPPARVKKRLYNLNKKA